MTKQKLLEHINEILLDGRRLLAGSSWKSLDGIQELVRIDAACQNIVRLLGRSGEIWKPYFQRTDMIPGDLAEMLGALQSVGQAIDDDLLTTVEDLVFAEAFNDLLEQAEHLFENGYLLAAGVLGRAVLEEHLRKWCQRSGCVPQSQRPTLQNFIDELTRSGSLNKVSRKHVEWMTAVGNDAAHNKGNLQATDVERLLRDLRQFLANHPLPS